MSVYDNASSDATPEVVEAAKKSFGENLKYVRHSENIGADANFHAALDGASRKYTMFMHDDDIANPNYLEYAIEAINIFGNVALLASDYTCIKLPPNSPAQFNHTEKKALVFNNQEEFAAYIFCDGRASYSSAIYRTEDLRKFNRPNIYGKIGDTPVMIDTSRGGKTVILADKNLYFYRIHPNQDSRNASNGPLRTEIVNRNLLFKGILANGTFWHRAAYFISYAEWLARHIRFAGANESQKRTFLKSLTQNESAGVMSKIYSIAGLGEIVRGLVRILRMSRFIIWRPIRFGLKKQ